MGGINTVMYYTPAILELAGVADKRTALLLALIPAGAHHSNSFPILKPRQQNSSIKNSLGSIPEICPFLQPCAFLIPAAFQPAPSSLPSLSRLRQTLIAPLPTPLRCTL